MHNPFLDKKYETPYETIPFEHIAFEHIEPALLEGMKRELADHERVVTNPETPTFDNTLIDYDADHTLSKAQEVMGTYLSVNTDDAVEELAERMQPLLSEHSSKLLLDERIWLRVKAVHDHPGRELTADEQKLLDDTYEGFVRSGALLPPEKKQELTQLRQEMGQLSLKFHTNILKDTNAFHLYLTDEADLAGLPDRVREAAAQAAKDKGLDGWLFTLQQPSYSPFMTYADNSELRRQLYTAKSTLCAKDNEYNNLALVGPIVNLHRKMAQLLGFRSYADMVLEKRMATDRAHVDDLLNRLFEAYYPVCMKEKEELEAFAREQMGDDYVMQPWDQSYWTHKLQKARYDLDSEMLRPYFELSQVKKGVFGLASRLYGISFVPHTDIEVYNKEVEVFEVLDADGSFLGLLYTDFHPRENKRSGAWMSTFRDQYIDKDGKDQRPLVSVVMNFTRPTDYKPALLSLGEVNTFLHEFGHALHALFSQVKFEAQSCTNVPWDFVELPSQFMENYATEPEFLRTFAFHYQTGEPMPQELIDRILRSNNFMVATGCIFQVALARLDMAYYSRTEDFVGDAREFENETWKDIKTMNRLPGECMTTHFSHIMCGGYSAGYYSYKWAEVLDADAFSLFQERGIFDRATAESFRREVLSRGDTEHPMTLYRRFRGQEPTIDALLRRNGIAPTPSSKRKEK